MKKIISVFLIMFFLFNLTVCTNERSENDINKINFGIIETTQSKYKSNIYWYDKELNLINTQKLKYADLGSRFYKPTYKDNFVYLIPTGIGNKKDSKLVIRINRDNLNVEEYSVDNISLNNVTVDDNYLFTINTLNADTHISRVRLSDNDFTEVIKPREYIYALNAFNNFLYMVSNKIDTNETVLSKYDERLKELKSVNITKYGNGGHKMILIDDNVYLNLPYNKLDKAESKILVFKNENVDEMEVINLKEKFPNDMYLHDDKLIVTHYDVVRNKGTIISIIDVNTGETKETVDLKTKLSLTTIIDDLLIVVNDEKISCFDLCDNFKLINTISTPKDNSTFMYLNGIINK